MEAQRNSHFTYILRCKDDTLYTGYTTDLKHRLKMHNEGKGAKYTRGRGPVELVYFEKSQTKGQAMSREAAIKQLSRDEKLLLIEDFAAKAENFIEYQEAVTGEKHMELTQILENRRTIRAYEPGKVLDKEILDQLIYAAQQAASWKNSETGRYYVVASLDKVKEVVETCLPEFNQQRAKDASALIITAFESKISGHDGEGNPTDALGDGWGSYDLGLQNANLLLKATELGLGTLIMGLRDVDGLRKMFDIPKSQILGPVIAVGIPAEAPAKPKRLPAEEIARFF